MNGTKRVAAALTIMMVSSSYASHEIEEQGANVSYGTARVIRVTPIIRYVEVSEPEEECFQDQIRSYHDGRRNTAGATIVGGLMGGLIGNQLGRGNGRPLSTFVGTVAGATIGRELARGSRSYETVENVRRCRIVSQTRKMKRIVGYWVDFEYRGEVYRTEMAEKPDQKIRVRVTVDPVE